MLQRHGLYCPPIKERKGLKYMGFFGHNQQRIALSHRTATILENDCILFGCMDRQGNKPAMHAFINKIFCSHFDRSDASMEMRLAEKKAYYQRLDFKHQKEAMHLIDYILKEEKKRLSAKIEELLSATPSTNNAISLNKETLRILEASGEEIFYQNRPSRYIRAVLEEYASFDSLVRQKIFYRKNIEMLESYARNHAVIEIKTGGRTNSHQIIPVFIRPDIYKTHLYLTGIINQTASDTKPVSYRLDRIDSVQYIRPGTVSLAAIASLEEAIRQKGIQYLASDKSHIRVRLSQEGIRKYQQLTYQRPAFSSIEGIQKDIYSFDIPEYQALVYFFKFGADAVILEPESLKQKFGKMYEEALEQYR